MGKTILIIEDEADLLILTEMRLQASGYEILKAATSEEALKILKTTKPDLILLDLLLPKMQGDTLCRQLKSNARFRHIPVILFTASVIRLPEKMEEIGADDYILKPFEPESLLLKIKKFIG